jgi:general stress protein 26
MADKLDLTTKEIPDAVNDALLRGRQLAVAYVDESGDPVVSFRGSVHVHGPQQLALWVRKRDSGLVKAIETRPRVHLIYYGGADGPGPRFLSFKGAAHVDPAQNDAVFEATVEPERNADQERKGLAVIVDVDSVAGFAADGAFSMERHG